MSDQDDKATQPTNPSSELPRFGDRTPTGGFVLDPHDDSDMGIGAALPRIRGAAESAGSAETVVNPAAGPAVNPAAETVAAPASDATTAYRIEHPGFGGAGGSAAPAGEPAPSPAANAASPLSDLSTPPPPLSSAPDTADTPLPHLEPDPAPETVISSEDRDRFGMENNRRRGRERAAAARAESEPASAVALADETEVLPKGKRFGGPVTPDDEVDALRRAARRGTTDLGLLVLRVTVGLLVAAHGAQKLFGVWGGPGIDGFQKFLENGSDPSLGFHQFTKVLAIASGVVELGGGAMLVVGVLTPIAASGVLAVMISAWLFKLTIGGQGIVILGPKGIELELLLSAATAAILLAGPGRLSLDFGRGWSRRPAWGSAAWLLIGVAGAVLVWIFLNGANPLVKH